MDIHALEKGGYPDAPTGPGLLGDTPKTPRPPAAFFLYAIV